MKKIGIMSMQRIYNYGSFLQAYGLKSLLEELDNKCSVEFVDYKVEKCLIPGGVENKLLRTTKKIMETLTLRTSISNKVSFISYKKNYGTKYYPLLPIDKSNYRPSLDILFIGSDEVFNCVQSNTNVGFSRELFGENNNALILASYAASFGNTTIEKISKYKIEEVLSILLSKFNFLSLRDQNSKQICESLGSDTACINLDPVLMYDYMNKCTLIPKEVNKRNYIILYAYSGRISKSEAIRIKEYAKANNKDVLCFGGIHHRVGKFINCSPFEVLAYFKHADEIITDTFHGSIFSIINRKKFVTLIRKSSGLSYGNEEKLTYLLNSLKLSERAINSLDELNEAMTKKIEYEETFDVIYRERRRTKEYLTAVLNKRV